MPTINEVWEQAQQINANLVTIHGDLDSIETRVDAANARFSALLALTGDGLASLSAGLAAMHARQDATNLLLASLLQHQQAMLCLLEQIAGNTCGTWNEAAAQTRLQRDATEAGVSLTHMFATTHPEGALAWARHREDRARVDACCPKEKPTAPCVERPCPQPALPAVPTVPGYPVFRPAVQTTAAPPSKRG